MLRLLLLLVCALLVPVVLFGAPTGSLSPSGGGGDTLYVATAETTDSTISDPTPVAGLAIPVAANTNYLIECALIVSSTATTIGVHPQLDGPASPTAVTVRWITQPGSLAALATATASTFDSFGAKVPHESGPGSLIHIQTVIAVLRNGANAGTVQPAISPETDTTVTAYAGSWCKVRGF